MAKKKRASASKRGGARRKSAPARKSTSRKAAPRRSDGKLRLKDVRRQIQTALGSLEKARARDTGRYTETAERFERMLSDIDWLCDPDNPEGCGPDMVFPLPS